MDHDNRALDMELENANQEQEEGIQAHIESFLLPISAERPSGESVRYDPVYDQIRNARKSDDPTLPQGVWESDLKYANWSEVSRLASEVLISRSKDLMIVSWLGEAWVHMGGLHGLEMALALQVLCCERFWDTLYPLAQAEDFSFRTAPLEWMATTYESILITDVILFDEDAPSPLNTLTLGHWQTLDLQSKNKDAAGEKAQQELKQIKAQFKILPEKQASESSDILMRCKTWLQRLEDWCNQHMGHDAPILKPLSDALNQALAIVQEPKKGYVTTALQPQTLPPEIPADKKDARAARITAAGSYTAIPASIPQSRVEAYQQLNTIADYLAQTEPHSPVPYLIYQAVEWGDKTLPELLGELIDSDDYARRLWSLLGVLP